MHRVWKKNPGVIGKMTPQRRDAYLRAVFFYANEGLLLSDISKKMSLSRWNVTDVLHGKAYRERVETLGLVVSSTVAICRREINPKISYDFVCPHYLKNVGDTVNESNTLYEAEEAVELMADNANMQEILSVYVIHLWDIKMEINKIMDGVAETHINKQRALKGMPPRGKG